jgi:hypothetical protein
MFTILRHKRNAERKNTGAPSPVSTAASRRQTTTQIGEDGWGMGKGALIVGYKLMHLLWISVWKLLDKLKPDLSCMILLSHSCMYVPKGM